MDRNDYLRRNTAAQENVTRLKERFKSHGLNGFNSRETLELLLAFAAPGQDPMTLAASLTSGSGGLGGVIEAHEQGLSAEKGGG